MLDLSKYSSIGEAVRDALETWPREVCLYESDRGEEKQRITYREFKERALPLAKWLQDAGFRAGDRASIIMTNQSKWLISAYAIFYCGGTLVPLDYKLKPEEQWTLLKHSDASVLITEYPIWRQLSGSPGRAEARKIKSVLVTEAPANADLAGATAWESAKGTGKPTFVPRKRQDLACIVYSSGTGGTPKGCMMTHENYLEQCVALTSLYPFWPGVKYLSILPTNHAIDFMVGFFGPFTCGAAVVHLRTLRPEFVREAFTKYQITYVSLVPLVLKNLQKGLQARFDELPPGKRRMFDRLRNINKALTKSRPILPLSRAAAEASARRVRRKTGSDYRRRGVHGAANAAIFLRPRHARGQWLRADGGGHGGNGKRSASISRRHRGQTAARHGSAHPESGRRRHRPGQRAQQNGHGRLPE